MGRTSVKPKINLALLESDRQRAAMTILEIAEKTPVGRPMVSLVFNGHSQSLTTLKAIAKVLGYDISRYLPKEPKARG